jgi:hypothetical protein
VHQRRRCATQRGRHKCKGFCRDASNM